MPDTNPTACLLVIGNEVLSGRTRDANIQFLAIGLGERGIPLREVRVIPDVPETIIGTVNEVRAKFDYVFTTGGIGPTHDDITSECVAAAFGVPWEPHPIAWPRMEAATSPAIQRGPATHGDDAARGGADRECHIGRARVSDRQCLCHGRRAAGHAVDVRVAGAAAGGRPADRVRAVHVMGLPEGIIAEGLGAVQQYPDLDLGSYPFYRPSGNGVALVAKGTDPAAAQAVVDEVTAIITGFGKLPVAGEPEG